MTPLQSCPSGLIQDPYPGLHCSMSTGTQLGCARKGHETRSPASPTSMSWGDHSHAPPPRCSPRQGPVECKDTKVQYLVTDPFTEVRGDRPPPPPQHQKNSRPPVSQPVPPVGEKKIRARVLRGRLCAVRVQSRPGAGTAVRIPPLQTYPTRSRASAGGERQVN